MFKVITMANSEIADDKEFLRKNKLCTINTSLHVLTMVILSRSCHGLAMILTSVPRIMICHDYTCDKQVLWESASFFSARQLSRFRPQVA